MAQKPREGRKRSGRKQSAKWAAIQREFEKTTLPVPTIAEKNGLKPAAVRFKAKEQGWTRPEGAPVDVPKPWVNYGSQGHGRGGPAMGLGMGGDARAANGEKPVFDAVPGRPPGPPSEKALAKRERAERHLANLDAIAFDKDANVNARVAASNGVLNRILGMPTATVNITTDDAGKMTDEELAAIAGGGS